MENGHDKLIAKIQHFYDQLVKKSEQYSEMSLTAEFPTDRHKNGLSADEYKIIAVVYKEIFEDFLYDADKPDK
jgi:hypothetical protein